MKHASNPHAPAHPWGLIAGVLIGALSIALVFLALHISQIPLCGEDGIAPSYTGSCQWVDSGQVVISTRHDDGTITHKYEN